MKDVIRYKFNGNPILIFRGVTLEQAQEWCSSDKTKDEKSSWFDGYRDTDTQCVNQKPKYQKYFSPDEL